MIHYWPKERKTAEELLKDDIFMKDNKPSKGLFKTLSSVKSAVGSGRRMSIDVSKTAQRMLVSSNDEIQVFLKNLSETESFISLDIGDTFDFKGDAGYEKISKIDNIDRLFLRNLAKNDEPKNYHFLSNDDIIYKKLKKIHRKVSTTTGLNDDLFKEATIEVGATKSKKLREINRSRNLTHVNEWKKGAQKTLLFPTNERHLPLRDELKTPGITGDSGFGYDAVMMD